jgi:6,7-dimethyl-8-ribityllumazine synthase
MAGAVAEQDVKPPPGARFAIVAARFNEDITNRLLDSAVACLRERGVPDSAMTVVRVPGSFEIPLAAKELALGGRYDAIICLGCVIRGDTRHFELVADNCAAGLREVSLECRVPLIFGVQAVETMQQALDRAGGKMDRGREAALGAIEMANVMRALRQEVAR